MIEESLLNREPTEPVDLLPVSNAEQKNTSKNKKHLWASILSIILHPLLMTTYGVGLLFVYTDFQFIFAGQYSRIMIPVFMSSFVIPLSCLYMLLQMRVITSHDVDNRMERTVPYIIGIASHIALFAFFYVYYNQIYIWFFAILLAPIIALLLACMINWFWKISVHMMGIGGLVGSVLSVSYNIKGINPSVLFIILFILAGVLGTARIILQKHTPAQVYAGFLLGFVVSYLCVWVVANLPYMIF